MRKKAIAGLIVLSFFIVLSGQTGCAQKKEYFGVRNKALTVPNEFSLTEAAIEKAEKSPGAQYAPEKIAKARELAKKGVKTYWGCRDKEAMDLLAEARNLAREAELAKAPPKPAPTPVVAAPAIQPPAAAPAVPKPVAVPPAPKRIIVLEGVNFGFDSVELTPQAQAILDGQAAILEKEPVVKVKIVGHSDSIGTKAYNQELSEKRAKAVLEFFVSKGISPDRLNALGYGESYPITTNWTEEDRAKNRRVELSVLE